MFGIIRNTLLALSLAWPVWAGNAAAQPCIEYGTAGDDELMLISNANRHVVQPFVSYMTIIGDQDLFNSKGVRLQNFLAVLQQDRANVNRFGRPDRTLFGDMDAEEVFVDETDGYFTTLERRALFAAMTYVPYCYMDPAEVHSFTDRILTGQSGFLIIGVFDLPGGGVGIHINEAG